MADEPAGFATDPPPRGAKKSNASWRGENNAPSRGVQVAIAFVLLLAIGGAIIGFLRKPTVPDALPHFVSFPLTAYGDQWPVNPWARQDADRLRDAMSEGARVLADFQQADKFQIAIDSFRDAQKASAAGLATDYGSRPLVVHISGFAAMRPEGLSLMLPPRSSTAPVEWLPVERLLTAIGECPAPKRLLILDIAHPILNAAIDAENQSVTAQLDRLLTDRKPPFAVMTACGPGQQSLPCDAEQSTVFAFYLAEGLRCSADGAIDGKHDNDIHLGELARYVEERTDRWATRVAGVRQRPTLYLPETGYDFIVSRYKEPGSEERFSPRKATEYPAELAVLWKNRAARGVIDDAATRADGTKSLLRAEQLALRAGGIGSAREALLKVPESWKSAPVEGSPPIEPRTTSPILRLPLTVVPAKELGEKLEAALAAKPEETEKAKAAWQAWQSMAVENPAHAAWLVWQKAIKEPPTPERLARWAQALDGLKPQFAEVVLLRRLSKYDFKEEPNRLQDPPSNEIAALLAAEAAMGRAVMVDAFQFRKVQAAFEAADKSRRTGETMLFEATKPGAAEAARNQLELATREINAAVARLQKVQESRVLVNRARIVLYDTLAAAALFDRSDAFGWKEWKDTCQATADLMANPERTDGAAARIRAWLERVESGTSKFIADTPRPTPAELATQAELLAGTALGAQARQTAWNAWLRDVTALHNAVREQDKESDRVQVPAPRMLVVETPEEATRKDRAGNERKAEARELMNRLSDTDGQRLDAARQDALSLQRWRLEQLLADRELRTRHRDEAAREFAVEYYRIVQDTLKNQP